MAAFKSPPEHQFYSCKHARRTACASADMAGLPLVIWYVFMELMRFLRGGGAGTSSSQVVFVSLSRSEFLERMRGVSCLFLLAAVHYF